MSGYHTFCFNMCVVCMMLKLLIRLRVRCQQLMNRKWFDYAVLVLIALNCITLAMERPNIPSNSFVRRRSNLLLLLPLRLCVEA